MITLLSRIFIKNLENIQEPGVRRTYGMLCSVVGIVLNILLFAGKYFAGILVGSIAITADAFNNLSDAGSSLVTLVGFRFSGMKPDHSHPFGHGRIEYVAGFTVSGIIILMAIELVRSSADKIIHPQPVDSSLTAVLILVVSILIKLYMYMYNRTGGKMIHSDAMKATSTDSLGDAAATLVVLLSLLFSSVTGIYIDGWCGVLVGLFILWAGYSSARETLTPLLGKAPDTELVQKIEKIVLAHDEILGIHDLIVHDYGPGRLIISLHGEVSGDGDIYEIHDAIDRIEKELNEKLSCESCLHMDPIETDNETVKHIRDLVAEKIATIDTRITIHDFRMVKGPTHTNLIFDALIPFDFPMEDEEARNAIDQLVRSCCPNCFTAITIDKSYV